MTLSKIDCEWGMAGIELVRQSSAVLIIVDVLSFSTAVDIATSRGAWVYPFPYVDMAIAQQKAQKLGAILARPRAAQGGQFSLSPASLAQIEPETRLLLPSPNGSRLSLACGTTPVLAGCLRNARAVALAAQEIAGNGSVGVVPAGERWRDGSLRPAIEDWLGAGAIIHYLEGPCSPEAQIAKDAWRISEENGPELVRSSRSGMELLTGGFSCDLDLAVAINISRTVPILMEGAYQSR